MNFDDFVTTHGSARSYASGAHVFRQGEMCASVFVVRSGILKAYYLDDRGRDTIKSFIRAGEVIGSLSAAHMDQPCTFSLSCLESCELVELDFKALFAASQSDLGIAQATIRFLLGFAMKKEQREKEFLTASAEERYARLLDRAPELFGAVTQKDIAKYLGITPVALSRIRQRRARAAED